MNRDQLAARIRCNFFAKRDNLDDAFEYAHMVFQNDPAMMTAMYVVLNTVAAEILKIGELSRLTVNTK
jgi:hypothetical protein